MVATQEEYVSRILNFEGKEQTDTFDTMSTSINIITEKNMNSVMRWWFQSKKCGEIFKVTIETTFSVIENGNEVYPKLLLDEKMKGVSKKARKVLNGLSLYKVRELLTQVVTFFYLIHSL
jgi:hypothetical protein